MILPQDSAKTGELGFRHQQVSSRGLTGLFGLTALRLLRRSPQPLGLSLMQIFCKLDEGCHAEDRGSLEACSSSSRATKLPSPDTTSASCLLVEELCTFGSRGPSWACSKPRDLAGARTDEVDKLQFKPTSHCRSAVSSLDTCTPASCICRRRSPAIACVSLCCLLGLVAGTIAGIFVKLLFGDICKRRFAGANR